jgi:hypothetical protein
MLKQQTFHSLPIKLAQFIFVGHETKIFAWRLSDAKVFVGNQNLFDVETAMDDAHV